MTTLFLTVPGIHCGHCAGTISQRLFSENGIHAVHVDVTSRLVEVRFDPRVTAVDTLKRLLEGVDYPVTAVSAAPVSAAEDCAFVADPALPLVQPLAVDGEAGGCRCCA